jgi:Arc/MetJ family transcription regulator
MYTMPVLKICMERMAMKKTTVLIDERLLAEAMKAIGARTKKEAIRAGLEALVKHHHRESLQKELGTFDIDLNLEELEKLRNAE